MSDRGNFDDGLETALQARARGAPEAYELEVVRGASTGSKFRVHRSAAGRLFVGSSPACDWTLDDRAISRRHLAFECEGAGLRVVDLKSTNGTNVNGLLVTSALLLGGETLTLGGSTIRVRGVEDAAAVAIPAETSFGRLLGTSPEMRRLFPLFARIAASDANLLIEGEAGTGKELLAETVHEKSARARGPLEVFDCSAHRGPSVEELLFGREVGGLIEPGALERAAAGTLLLDEVSELDPLAHPALVRALERGEYRRIGGGTTLRSSARIVSTTRQDLEQRIQARSFSDALFYKLAVTRVELPPLRSRDGDIPFLARYIWERLGAGPALPADLPPKLEGREWPGNVRELHHTLARIFALGDLGETFEREVELVPRGAFDPVLKLDLPITRARQIVVEAFDRQYVADVLGKHGGNVTRAAMASGLAHRYFQILRAKRHG